MRYLIIGLGIYGSNLAIDLTNMGHEVIGADISAERVEALKDYIDTTYIVDSTEESALNVLPLKNVDLVIVAIGENFGASVKTVGLLKSMGVTRIYARAIDKIHKAILEGLDIQRILTPEQRAAHDLVNEMELGTRVDSMAIDSKNHILKFELPEYFHGMTYDELKNSSRFGLTLIAATRPVQSRNILGIKRRAAQILDIGHDKTLRVEEGDIVVCYGSTENYTKLFRTIN